MGCTSTNPLTITEHSEKNSDDSVASMMPTYEHEQLRIHRERTLPYDRPPTS